MGLECPHRRLAGEIEGGEARHQPLVVHDQVVGSIPRHQIRSPARSDTPRGYSPLPVRATRVVAKIACR